MGNVKKRLAGSIGNEKALQVYHLLLAHTRNIASQCSYDKFLFYDSFINEEDEWSNAVFEKHLQKGFDPGERITNAFEYVFEKGYRRAALLKISCIDLSLQNIVDGVESLKVMDFSAGPTHAGNFYMVGMNKFTPHLFLEKDKKVNGIFKSLVKEIGKMKASMLRLPLLHEISTPGDLKHLNPELYAQ